MQAHTLKILTKSIINLPFKISIEFLCIRLTLTLRQVV